MFVIGTAGHVDHGKTTLIEALTGINPDRLPEEKARGMTIDLGFAWLDGGAGERIGVIDVPGHERFIRNMVAGAWSLDCALLLVAADDGWMQQTQDHAVVLASLNVRSVILVVTKTDAVPAARVQEVAEDALARAAGVFGKALPRVEVSALRRSNLEALKTLILGTLAGLPPRARGPGVPFLHVDRVFTIKGAGLVVTGSLAGAELEREQELELLPQHERVRIRGIQTYNAAVDRAVPVCRVALNLSRPKAEIQRGNCLAPPGSPFACETHLIARVEPLPLAWAAPADSPEEPALKNHAEVEVALGTAHGIAQIHFLADQRFARIVLREPVPALWNQAFLIIRHGGSSILGRGRILWFGDIPREERSRLTEILAALPDPASDMDRFGVQLRFHGRARIGGATAAEAGTGAEAGNGAAGVGTSAAEAGTGPGSAAPRGAIRLDDWLFDPAWLAGFRKNALTLAGLPAGISLGELSSKLGIEEEAARACLSSQVKEGSLVIRNGLYFTEGSSEPAQLPPAARRLLAEIEKAGRVAFEPAKGEGTQKDLNTLVRLQLVVPLEGSLYYAREAYTGLCAEVLAGRKPGERFTVPGAKERTGLSRKYMLPLLNRMEKDGLLRREGDVRVVL